MPDEQDSRNSNGSTPRIVKVEGSVQGLVIGDYNTVTQHFHIQGTEFPTPRECPPLTSPLIGREKLLDEIKTMLLSEAGFPIALYGMAGVGKSMLAAFVATLPEVEDVFSDGCFWVDLQNGDVMEALARMAQAFGQNVETYENTGSRSRAVRSILNDKKILTVLDNAWREEDVIPFLAANPRSALLLTTRDEELATLLTNSIVRVDRFDTRIGAQLLVQLTGVTTDAEHQPLINELVELLGGLPLALELAGKQARKEIRRPGFSWSGLITRLKVSQKRLGLGRGEHTVRNAFEQTWEQGLDIKSREHFAKLGLFPRRDLYTGEIAAAWNEDEQTVLEGINDLMDLSLLQPVDRVTMRLHPLLQDFAEAKNTLISSTEQLTAHQRICDYYFQSAPADPASVNDILPVLRSHYHAWKAQDKVRAQRVFPWYQKASDPQAMSIAVAGFLIDHGYTATLVKHYEIELDFARTEGAIPLAYAHYWLGDAQVQAGDLVAGAEHLKQALAIINKSAVSEDTKNMARGRFSFGVGQVCASIGDFDGAIAAYQITLELDRGAHDAANELLTMLQIGDLYQQKGDYNKALDIYQEVRNQAHKGIYPAQQAMALARLAELMQSTKPETALRLVKEALELDNSAGSVAAGKGASRIISSAFAGREGARYASRLGQLASELAFNGQPAFESALRAFSIALKRSEATQSWYEQGLAFYWLGHLFEHLFLIDAYVAERSAAWACYKLADAISDEMELPPGINPAERIEHRILPQIDKQEQQRLEPLPGRSRLNLLDKMLCF